MTLTLTHRVCEGAVQLQIILHPDSASVRVHMEVQRCWGDPDHFVGDPPLHILVARVHREDACAIANILGHRLHIRRVREPRWELVALHLDDHLRFACAHWASVIQSSHHHLNVKVLKAGFKCWSVRVINSVNKEGKAT